MKNDNPYSKYRYDNTFDLKYRSNDKKVGSMYGADLKGSKNMVSSQLDKEVASSWAVTWVVNHVFRAKRITNVDSSILSPNYKGPTYFKPFKL